MLFANRWIRAWTDCRRADQTSGYALDTMICPCSVSRLRLLRRFCALVCAILGCCAIPPARAQDLDKPVQTIDEEITAFAFAPDGRIVYSVRRPYKTKKFDLEHDDIWIQDSAGKRRRILQGDKFTRGDRPFTYAVDGFRWSPNGRIILAQLFTTTLLDDFGKTQDATATLVLEENGKEVKLGGTDSFINPASNAEFLPDNLTIVYSTPVVQSTARPMYSFPLFTTNAATGPAGQCFEGRTFLDSDPIPRTNSAVAVERDRAQTGPPRLQHLDLLAQEDRELATLDNYAGGLTVSPGGHKVAYFIDNEILEVRDLAEPDHFVRMRVGLGMVRWSPDENANTGEARAGKKVWRHCFPECSIADSSGGRQAHSRARTYAKSSAARAGAARFCNFAGRQISGGGRAGQAQLTVVSVYALTIFEKWTAKRG